MGKQALLNNDVNSLLIFSSVPWSDRIDQVIKWMKLPPDEQ